MISSRTESLPTCGIACRPFRSAGALLLLIFAASVHIALADCSPAVTGLVGWWPGDGSPTNIAGTNHGILSGGATASAPGLVGNCFTFDGTNGFVQITNSTVLQPTNLTLEAWVRFASLDSAGLGGSPAGDQYLVFKQNTRTSDFEGFDLSKTRIAGSDYFRFIVSSASGQTAVIRSATAISAGVWYHVAAVRGSNFTQLYVNGTLERQTNVTFAQSYTNLPLYFGTSGQATWDHKLKGSLDEVSLYNRALSSNEIAAVFAAGAAGKCKAPNITTQPQSQVVAVGANATFTTAATGFGTLSYRWRLNNTPLASATNSSLTLTNVQLANQGLYSVTVSNALGATTSSNASLVVVALQPGVPYISGFSPDRATSGASLNLTGFNFSPSAASNVVYFGAVRANILAASANQLTVTVPVGATFAPITVTVGGLVAFANAPFQPTFPGDGTPISAATFAPRQDLPAPSGPHRTVIADLDGDGKPDLAIASLYSHVVSFFRNTGTNGPLTSATFGPRVDLPALVAASDDPAGFIGADMDGDGKIDLVFADRVNNRLGIYRNLAVAGTLDPNSFAPPVYFTTGNDPRHLRVADLDGDGRPDLVAGNNADGTISILRNLSAAGVLDANSFAPHFDLVSGAGTYDMVIQDLDGDARPDLAVINPGTTTLAIFRNVSTPGALDANSFAPHVDLPALPNNITIIAGDVDGDGKPDLLAGGTSGAFSVYRNLATFGALTTNSFAAAVDFGNPGWVHNLALGDLNGDGKPDVIVVGELNSYLRVYQNASAPGSFSTGSLTNGVDYATGWNAWGVSTGDLDGDGRPDVVFCNAYENSVTLYRNAAPYGGPPLIITPPSPQTAPASGSASFTVTAGGAAPLSYRWRFNGVPLTDGANISGATNATLGFSNLTLAQAGNYTVVVTNAFGAVTSAVAALTVVSPVVLWNVDFGGATTSKTGAAAVGQSTNDWWNAYPYAGGFHSEGGVVLLQTASTNSTPVGINVPGAPGSWGNGSSDPMYEGYVYPTFDPSPTTVTITITSLPPGNYDFLLYANDGKFQLTSGGVNYGVKTSLENPVINPPVWQEGKQYVAFRNVTVTNSASPVIVTVQPGLSGYALVSGLQIARYTPAIITQPTNVTVVAGNPIVLQTLGEGMPAPGYQWFFNGNPVANGGRITGATSNTLTITNAQPADAGNYFAVLSHPSGSITSQVATVLVGTPPAIVQSPASQTNAPGGTASFTALVSGTAPLVYQWWQNGTALADDAHRSGSTTTNLTLTSLTVADAGSYTLVVTNFYGRATSAVAVLSVPVPPTITQQPQSRTNLAGSLATFSVTANGTSPLTYQWFFNGAALANTARISGANSNSLSLANLVTNDAGNYWLVISNPVNVATSAVVTLTVIPVICFPPDAGLAGWWQAEGNGQDAANANVATLQNGVTFAPGEVGQSFSFDGVDDLISIAPSASLNVGTNTGFTIECWLNPSAVVPQQPLVEWNSFPGANPVGVHFWISVYGAGDLYANLVDTAGNSHNFASVAGVVLPNSFQHAALTYDKTSGLATLYYNGTPVATQNFGGFTPQTTFPLYLGLRPSGGQNFYKGLLDEVGIYNRALAPAEIQLLYNSSALGRCATPPAFPQPLSNVLVAVGNNAVFTAVVAGSQPLNQKWFFNGLPLADNAHVIGSTSNVLILVNAQTNDIGNYFLVASNSAGVSTSSIAQLVVGVPPSVVQAPLSQTNLTGLNGTFSVLAAGDPTLGYRWRFNGNILSDNARTSGTTNNALSISNLVVADAGNYDVVITNGFGSVTSAVAVLTLLNAPVFAVQPISRSIVPGLPATFSAVAVGDAPITYQWQFNGADILDATNNSYSIAAVGTTNLGVYRLVASNAVAVTISAEAAMVSGNIAAWGRNTMDLTVVPVNATNVIALAAGLTSSSATHTLALRADGGVIGWGNNGNGQLNIPAGLSNVVAVAAGGTHSLALRANGTVAAWGNNGNGQLNVPATLSNVIAIAAGGAHSLALRADGKVIGWGYNSYGQTTMPTNLNKVVAIAAGLNHSLALRADGVAFNWGYSIDRVPSPAGGPGIGTFSIADGTGIAGGNSHSLFSRSNGTVFATGSNTYTQTNVPASLTNATAVSAGDYYSMALRAEGSVVVWGRNEYTQTNVPPGVSNAVAIAAGGTTAFALLSDGRPLILQPPVGGVNFVGREQTFRAIVTGTAPMNLQWQFNDTAIPDATNTTLALSSLALTNNGNFRLVASNALGVAVSVPVPLTVLDQTNLVVLSQPPVVQTNYLGDKVILNAAVVGNGPLQYQWKFNGTNIAGATSQDLIFDPIQMTNAGNYTVGISNLFGGLTSVTSTQRVIMVRTWGYFVDGTSSSVNAPLSLTNAVAVAAGYAGYGNSLGHYLALRADGKITMWMSSQSPTAITNIPASVTNGTVTAIAGGLNSSIALRSDGVPFNWGSTAASASNMPAPATSVIAVAAGDNHFLALRADGTVATWGSSLNGLLNIPASATNLVAIAAGTTHSLALRGNGTVAAWGLGSSGQTNVPPTLTNVIAISAGNQFSAALRADGTVVQWGNGMINYPVPTGLSNIVAIAAGYNHLLALRSDGTLSSWGYYYSGAKDSLTPSDLANIIQISAIGDRDAALLGARTPAITVQPWDRALLRGSNTTFIAKSVSPAAASFQWRFNGADILGATNDTLRLTNSQVAQSGAYQLVVSNRYGLAVSRNAKLTVTLPLAESLDTTNVTWLSTSSVPWFGQPALSHDGVDAARSGDISHSQESVLQTTLNGPAAFSFWWKVSSEAGFDTLEFKLDGATQTTISGEVDWEQRSYTIPSGAHTLLWRYAKDASSSAGQDAAWVDQFIYTPNAPVITVQPLGQTVNVGSNVSFNVTATGASPFTYQWLKNGTNAGLAGSSGVTLNNLGRAARGVYSVIVANSGGSTLSSNAILNVLVPQQFGTPTVLPNGAVLFPSGDVNGGSIPDADLALFEAQASTNLVDWVTLPNSLSLTNGLLLLQDPVQTNYPARYYRIIEH